MKAVVAFFLIVCVFLFGGYYIADAKAHPNFSFPNTQNLKAGHSANTASQQGTVLAIAGERQDKIDLISVEDDDLTRKLISLAKSVSFALCCLFILHYAGSVLCNSFSPYHLIIVNSRKFVALRVLRI